MSIITKNFKGWFVCTNKKGKTQTVYSYGSEDEKDYPFAFEVNFADIASPQENTVTFYNMSKEHRNFYQKGCKCHVSANWNSDNEEILTEGYITKIDVPSHDGVTDSFIVHFTEGTSYSNVSARKLKVKKKTKVHKTKTVNKTVKGHYKNKRVLVSTTQETYKSGVNKGKTHTVRHYITKKVWVKPSTKKVHVRYRASKVKLVNKTFRKGTSYSALIRGIASQSGIKLAKIELAKNPKLKKSYTAHGKPLNLLKQVVKKTGSKMTYVRGKLEIVNPRSKKRTWYVIDDTDLVTPPSCNQSNDSDDGVETWEITTPLIPDITTNVGIKMNSKYLKGTYFVKSGQHTFDGESPQTQCSLEKI